MKKFTTLLCSLLLLASCNQETISNSNSQNNIIEESEVISSSISETTLESEVSSESEIASEESEILSSSNEEISLSESEIISEESSEMQEAPEIVFNKKVDMSYSFTGDNKDKPGFAEGIITITPTVSKSTTGYYLLYFADDYQILPNHDELVSIKITGETVTYEIKDGIYLPSEASKLVVFESSKMFLDNPPSIEKAIDIIDIPTYKRLKLSESNMTLGVTSDVHINFEELGFGSLLKWDNTLDFFGQNNTDYVIITGDMTGDSNLEYEYTYYIDSIDMSLIPLDNVFESIGNHGNSPSTVDLFAKYTNGSKDIRPFENSPYYHVFIEGNDKKDTLFIFMAQELKGPSDSASYDNFSKQQIDWLENLLNQYGNTDTNIFIIEHSPFLNFGPGDRHNGDYTRMITFKEEYVQTMRLKKLLETYKDVILLSGHTHLTYYENENYSNENDSFCHMVHVSSGTQTSSYNHGDTLISDTDGRYDNSETYGSEGYIVNIYDDYIIFTAYNISTKKIIPVGCIIIEL